EQYVLVAWAAQEGRDIQILRVLLAFVALRRFRRGNEPRILLFKWLVEVDVAHGWIRRRCRRCGGRGRSDRSRSGRSRPGSRGGLFDRRGLWMQRKRCRFRDSGGFLRPGRRWRRLRLPGLEERGELLFFLLFAGKTRKIWLALDRYPGRSSIQG